MNTVENIWNQSVLKIILKNTLSETINSKSAINYDKHLNRTHLLGCITVSLSCINLRLVSVLYLFSGRQCVQVCLSVWVAATSSFCCAMLGRPYQHILEKCLTCIYLTRFELWTKCNDLKKTGQAILSKSVQNVLPSKVYKLCNNKHSWIKIGQHSPNHLSFQNQHRHKFYLTQCY